MSPSQAEPAADPAAGMAGNVAVVRPLFIDSIGRIDEALREPALTIFDAIATSNWALEWGMAGWIGDAYGLDDHALEVLRSSNAYLIAFARLVDDVIDGESRFPTDVSTRLAVVLQHLWMSTYHELLRGSRHNGRFWSLFERELARWMRACRSGDDGVASGPRPPEEWLEAVAERAAFIAIGFVAGCLAAGRDDVLDDMDRALRDLFVGIVMLDDIFDWHDDLDAGRPNAFVRYVYGVEPGPVHRRDASAAVAKELYVGGAHSYFEALLARLGDAHRHAVATECAGLAEYIRWYADEAAACGHYFVDRALASRKVLAATTGLKRIDLDTTTAGAACLRGA
jgi:hypothetical protein